MALHLPCSLQHGQGLGGVVGKILRERKLNALQGGMPSQIVTASIGCLVHLQAGAAMPVQHWIEMIGGWRCSISFRCINPMWGRMFPLGTALTRQASGSRSVTGAT